MKNEYRTLTVKDVHKIPNGSEDHFLVDFDDSKFGLQLTRGLLERMGIITINPGDRLLVKGRHGNTNMDLCGIDSVEEIRRP